MKTNKIGLIHGGAAQRERDAPATVLYTSELFIKAKAFVRKTCDDWAILSDMHGLLMPDTIVRPYACDLTQTDADHLQAWSRKTRKQITKKWRGARSHGFVVIAPEEFTRGMQGLTFIQPFTGLEEDDAADQIQRLLDMMGGEHDAPESIDSMLNRVERLKRRGI